MKPTPKLATNIITAAPTPVVTPTAVAVIPEIAKDVPPEKGAKATPVPIAPTIKAKEVLFSVVIFFALYNLSASSPLTIIFS